MAAARAAAALVCLAGGLVLPEPAAADEDLTTLNSDREDFQCDKVYLGEKVGWADVYKYHDDDKSCKIEFSELQAVCKVHAAECMDFLKSKQDKSKTGMMDCHSHDMTTRMNSGTQDVCCDYTDGKFCALFTPSSADDTGEECVKGASNPNPPATRLPAHDGGVVLDSKILRMPLPTRGCADGRTAVRFTGVDIPQFSQIDEAYLLFKPTEGATTAQDGPIDLQIRVEWAVDAKPLKAENRGISSRKYFSTVIPWAPKLWHNANNVQMSVNIGPLLQSVVNQASWKPKNAILVQITSASSGKTGMRVAKSFDNVTHTPGMRVVYHTSESLRKSMKAYNDSLYSGWSTTSLVLLVCMASSTMAICCSLYHKRLEKKRGGRYKTVAGADEMSKLADGYYSDTTDDEETPSRLRNPVAKRKAIAGATEGLDGKNDTAFTYRDSSGNVLSGAGPK